MDPVIEWLLDGDPAIRWQTERDLCDAPAEQWQQTRELVATTGWGHDFLARQDPECTWAGGLYQPKWTSTTYTMMVLRRLGLPPDNPRAAAACDVLLERADWVEGGISYFDSYTKLGIAERCVNGMLLSLFAYFGLSDERVEGIAQLLIDVAMKDGGWNCQDNRGATHSSFHTTISALEGLHLWREATGSRRADDAIADGHEFLLRHQLYRSHHTGEVINPNWTKFWFPPRWHYDILRGLDHLQDVGANPDARAGDAIEIVRSGRRPDGKWGKGSQYGGETFFALEPGRVPGRWNTLRALRVLRWWDA